MGSRDKIFVEAKLILNRKTENQDYRRPKHNTANYDDDEMPPINDIGMVIDDSSYEEEYYHFWT